jgi:hypothetical protein
MQTSNVRRLLFPSIAAATLVFGLTLLFLGTQKADWFEQVAKTRKGDLDREYTLTHRGRDAAIRVVGSAIVLSVATGILTVELLRKWYAYREDIDQKVADLGLTSLMSADAESNLEPELEAGFEQNPIAPKPDLKSPDLANPDLQINQLQWNQSSSLDANPSLGKLSPVRELACTDGQTDRPLRPNSLQMHYVLEYENHRYKFVRTATSRSKMLRYSAILQSQDPTQEVIAKLNPDGETYSLWIQI